MQGGEARGSGQERGLQEPPQNTGTSLQQGKTWEVKPGGEILHRSGHVVNGMIDLVFVGIQSFSSIHVIPQILHCLFHIL